MEDHEQKHQRAKAEQLQDGEGKEQQEEEKNLGYPSIQGEGYPFRSFTKDERKNYAMVTSKSGGFECPSVPPGVTFPGILIPINLENIPVESLNGLHDFAKLALKDYNERNNTSHQFVNLIKVNASWNGCTMRYITFQAGSPALNFEAKVVTFMCNSEVKFCRVAQEFNPAEALKTMPWLEKWSIAMGEGQMQSPGQSQGQQ